MARTPELPIVIWILSVPLSHKVSNPSKDRSDISRSRFKQVQSAKVTEQTGGRYSMSQNVYAPMPLPQLTPMVL